MQELISDLNKKFNNKTVDLKNLDSDSHGRLLNQIKFSVEELKELVDSESERDRADALGDFVVFLKGFRYMMGAKDDYSTNFVALGTLVELSDSSFDTFETVNSTYPVHDLKNALTQFGYKGSFDELESAMIEYGVNAIATSVFSFSDKTSLSAVAQSTVDTIKPLVNAAISFAYQKDFPKAMFFVDRCIALSYIVCIGAGINLDKVLVSIYESNMTKFCDTEKNLKDTIEAYAAKGIEVVEDVDTVFPYKVVRSPKDQIVGDKEFPKGKFLKSTNFKEPTFTMESIAL